MKPVQLTAVILAAIISLRVSSSGQSVPALINYQGRLTDQTGTSLPVGQYTVQFRLWDSPTSFGTNSSEMPDLIWAQQQDVTIQSNGVFNVILGSGTQIINLAPAVNNLAYAFSGSNCFLGVTVTRSNGFVLPSPGEIAPRQQLLTVPYAVSAVSAMSASNAANGSPSGTISAFAGTNVPLGWLLCDGRTMSSSQYPQLYQAIGTNWGAGTNPGAGTNDFSLPDLRGMFLRGVNGSRSDKYADPDAGARTNLQGTVIAPQVGSLQLDDVAPHTHEQTISTYSAVNRGTGVAGTEYMPQGITAYPSDIVPQGFGSLPTRLSTGHESRPKNAYVNYIIKY